MPAFTPPTIDQAYSTEISSPSSSSSHDHQNPYYSALSDPSSPPHHKSLLSLRRPDSTTHFISFYPNRLRNLLSPPHAHAPLPSLPISQLTSPISPPTTPQRQRNKLRKLPPSIFPSHTRPPPPDPHCPPSSFHSHYPRSNGSTSPTTSSSPTSPNFHPPQNPSDFTTHAFPSINSPTISTSSHTPLLPQPTSTLSRFRRTLTLPSRKLTKRRPPIAIESYAPLAPPQHSASTLPIANNCTAHPEQHHTPQTSTIAIPSPSDSAPTHNVFTADGHRTGDGANALQRRSTLSFSFQPSSFGNAFAQGKAKNRGEHRKSFPELERERLPPMNATPPFEVHIPTEPHEYGPWRDNPSLSMTAIKRGYMARSTDALAELAWMGGGIGGTTVMLDKECSGGWRSTCSSGEEGKKVLGGDVERRGNGKAKFTLGEPEGDGLGLGDDLGAGSPVRPKLVRRDAKMGVRRRWTLAMAMTDDGITDEALVEELEKLRMGCWEKEGVGEVDGGSASEEGVDASGWGGESWFGDGVPFWEENGGGTKGDDVAGTNIIPSPSSSLPSHNSPLSASASASASWETARRALLTCRELVRTERHYLSSLRTLQSGCTSTAPPPLMLRYVGELARVSEGLLGRMEEDPSAWGVAGAFLGAEEGVEGAFVAWCGVVGGWFVGGGSGAGGRGGSGPGTPGRRLSKTRVVEKEGEGEGAGENASVSPLKRTVSTWRRSMPSLASLNGSPIASGPSPVSTATFLGRRKEREREGQRRPSVRDLAILPTQRVMRYVLLYRDLLAHTPSTSPSRVLVERAVDVACRIAQKCDRAQGNSAFLQG